MSGLPVDATARDLRRWERARRVAAGSDPAGRPLPVHPPPDDSDVSEAVSRLRDPGLRLLEEFFWFWREPDPDPEYQALCRGDLDAAASGWRPKAGRDVTAAHNLAVLAHVRALDAEYDGRGTVATRFWGTAFDHWRALLDNERVWQHVAERAVALDARRLSAEVARQLRDQLPRLLLSINTGLASRAGEAGRQPEFERCLTIIRGSGFTAEFVDEAVNNAVRPLVARVRAAGARAAAQARGSPRDGADLARRLLDSVNPQLAVLDSAYPPEHPIRAGVHDDVALTVLACLVPYNNETDDEAGTLELLGTANSVAETPATISRINENIGVVRRNLDAQQRVIGDLRDALTLGVTCWFCESSPAVPAAALEVKIHGEVTAQPAFEDGELGIRLGWKSRTVKIPRCLRCLVRTRRSTSRGCLPVVLVFGFTGIALAADWGNAKATVGLAVLAALAIRLRARTRRARTRAAIDCRARAYPPLAEQLDAGWSLGAKPDAATRKL